MAFLRPNVLTPVTFVYQGAVDNLADWPLGVMQMDVDVHYIDVAVHDANATFDETDITFEYDEAGGSDTVIDVITIAAQAGTPALNSVDRDALTNFRIPAGARILATIEDVTTGADLGFAVTFWVVPTS